MDSLDPKIGQPMEFCHITTRRHGVTMSTRRGVVRKLRTVRQALVVPAKGNAQWVDLEVHEDASRPTVVTTEMVDRFLTWPVPADVFPDGIPGQEGRTGTNLLTATQARAMLEHVLAGTTK